MFELNESLATRTCRCGACGGAISAGENRVQVVMPWQKRGVNYHKLCLDSYTAITAEDDTTSIGSSKNCNNHTVSISKLSPIIFQYFTHYGMKKVRGGEVKADFENAESIGATIKTAFANNAKVKVNSEVVNSLAEYDAKTKAVCMR